MKGLRKTSLLCVCLLLAVACISEHPENGAPADRNSSNTTSTPTVSSKPTSTPSLGDNQMSLEELRARLDEVKSIELEARRMVPLRRNWATGVAECMRIIERLKPRIEVVRDEAPRMLSLAGIYTSNAAVGLISCADCVENNDDDCSDARTSIKQAETELKKEMRRK